MSTPMVAAVQELYAYSAWANARVLDTAAQLPIESYLSHEGYGSVRDTLVHIASAQWTWLQRWLGNSSVRPWDPTEFENVAALRERWSQVDAETANYIAALEPDDLLRNIAYLNYVGETWEYPLWQQLVHQVNHATQHRSEAALIMTQLGYSPGWLDLLFYADERDQRS